MSSSKGRPRASLSGAVMTVVKGALIGIANALGVSPEITAGAVISGAYFGDKLSPLSDTTNLAAAMAETRISLALQGGGAHGAFTWGVLDRLLDEPDLAIDGISGTSAGAINASGPRRGVFSFGATDETAAQAPDDLQAYAVVGQHRAAQAQYERCFAANPGFSDASPGSYRPGRAGAPPAASGRAGSALRSQSMGRRL